MKRVGQWAIGIGLFVTMGFLTIEPGYAKDTDDSPRCTLATLKGQYLFVGSGILFPPAFGVKAVSQVNSAGYHIFNGDGTGTDFVTLSINGVIVPVPSPTPISYTLNFDCTGTYTVLPSGPHFNIFVAHDGEALTVIATDPGVALSEGPQRRVGSH
jgi:hypothetical protein